MNLNSIIPSPTAWIIPTIGNLSRTHSRPLIIITRPLHRTPHPGNTVRLRCSVHGLPTRALVVLVPQTTTGFATLLPERSNSPIKGVPLILAAGSCIIRLPPTIEPCCLNNMILSHDFDHPPTTRKSTNPLAIGEPRITSSVRTSLPLIRLSPVDVLVDKLLSLVHLRSSPNNFPCHRLQICNLRDFFMYYKY